MKSITLFILIFSFFSTFLSYSVEPPDTKTQTFKPQIIDSDMTFEEAIKGTKAPREVIDSLCLLNVRYYSTDGKIHQGQLVVNKAVKSDIEFIFEFILKCRFPVAKVIPIVKYNWSDEASMKDNNTSAFNYRFIAGTTRMSNHAFGKAIDINPFFNPVVYPDGKVSPTGAKYEPEKPGRFSDESAIVKLFLQKGWRWGNKFKQYHDNHHFDKL